MHSFVYSALPGKVLFGFGTIDKVAYEIRQLGCQRGLVASTPQQAPLAADLAARLGDLSVGAFTEAAMHPPVAVRSGPWTL
jgi:maleylacetate reductase